MTHVLTLGAINKFTGEYVHPKIANKKDEYLCIECNKELILCQGDVRCHYFRHKVDTVNPCNHYSNPSETQIHRDAKILLKTLLERKNPISLIRNCICCKKNEEFEIPEISETSIIHLEYRFEYNGAKIADVAYIDNGELLCIFEICNTHKTCNEHRPEPWFEIDAETLIKIANDNSLSQIQIPCIRCEKCEDCIETDKNNIIKKSQALDILYNWFNTGIEIYPFKYDYGDFAGVSKNSKCHVTGENVDLILSVEPEYKIERYYIRLIYNSSNYYFVKEQTYALHLIGVYYVDIDWILSQTKIPKRINYIASLDCYCHDERNGDIFYKDCKKCTSTYPFWIKRENMYDSSYKVIDIGCLDCGYNHNSEYINCERCCNSSRTPLCVMETNVISIRICKSCDIELYGSGNIYLSVSFSQKDEAKQLGASWDSTYKKWFINKNHKNIDIILNKWKKIW